jgi:hypothetical protein
MLCGVMTMTMTMTLMMTMTMMLMIAAVELMAVTATISQYLLAFICPTLLMMLPMTCHAFDLWFG